MYEASDDQLTGFASEASNLTGNGRRGDNELAELEAKISAEWETNDKIEQKARRGLRRRPDSGQYKRPGVRINVVKNPWTSPSSRHFPRKDIWEWSGAEDGENESFRKDFFKATQLQVSLNESSTQELAAANSGIGDASQISGHDLTNIGSNQLRKAPSLRTSIHEQLMATADIRRAIRDGAKELLIAKHNASLTASTSQQVFVSACRKADIVPEPLLVPRKEPESTMEASKMHQNLNVRTKKDLLKLESRDVILWDWRAIAKGRTPDELRLEHFGMGDRYMPALAEALEADAKHALQGKRAFCRLQLAGCRISARGIKSLAPSLREHPRVIRIDLSRNALGPWAAEPLCAIFAPSMPASCTLTALDLSHNGLGDLAIANLFQALEHSVGSEAGNGSQIANSLESKAFQPCPPSGNGPAPSMLAVSSQDRRTSMAKYDYRVLKAQALARPSNLSNALLQSIQTGGPLADVQEANSKKLLENACGLSLSQNEPVCPAFATLMLPPGRVYFKFIVRGREIFARDADTCWTLWPLHKHSELAARSWVVEKPASALRAQEFPTVANFVDLSWPGKPVGGLADPDPGSERPQPAPAWSIKRSLFRHHHCDNARKLAEAFNSDWERVLENHYVVKAGGDELPFIRELMWAHFADICTLFALHSCEGENNFALDFAEVKVWARSGDQPILPEHVSDEVLYEVYDKSALIEARHATNQFGRHYSFMVKRSGESVETDSGMLRHQLLQFLILLAGRVFSTVSLTSFVASHQDQEIARSQLRRVAPRRPSSLQSSFNQGSGAAGLPLHGSPLSLAARSQNSSQADQGHPEFGTPCFKSPFAAVHHLLQRALQKPGEPYIHRDVFRRGHMFFQDVVNVFARRIDDLRRIFDAHSVKGHVLHDFIPSNSWEDIFHQIHPGYSKVPLRRMFVLSKSTFVDFDDVDFAPGLCFLEFLECLARLAHLDNLAVAVLQAFEEAGAGCSPCSLKETKAEDSLATRLELVINQLLDSFDRR
ncbi:F-actin-uncapping protein LRRC16A [Hondaea fermentalgiana]|uniref:F-actin-uncapping protein LRRC16A n=1 Tax=Hondaea fermentalgiana TaxID=2315210 RepID=A0A2R5GDT8_9STRA|nr:F-actin-uncapping protein LRRC16A [Hondaea fermentalgiana]|eukprot:GBG26823.1 F-actin-uncapping protein LRRC16A [Hondaea fermentalgiana]